MRKWLAMLLLLSASAFGAERLEILVGASPGGGLDRIARSVVPLLKPAAIVLHKAGGNGNVALLALQQRYGDGRIALLYTSSMLASYKKVTPLALMVREPLAFVVNAASPIKDMPALIAQLKQDTAGITVGSPVALGNDNHLAVVQLAQEHGIDPTQLRMIVYKGGAEALTALLGNHISLAVISASNTPAYVASGHLRVLGTTSLAWRGFVGPLGLSAAQADFWIEQLVRVAYSEEWQAVAKSHDWLTDVVPGAAFVSMLEREARERADLFKSLGLDRF